MLFPLHVSCVYRNVKISISWGASLFFSSFLPELALSFLPTHLWGQLEPEAFPTHAYSISFRPKRARHPDPWRHVLTSLASPQRMNGLRREREFWQDACPERCPCIRGLPRSPSTSTHCQSRCCLVLLNGVQPVFSPPLPPCPWPGWVGGDPNACNSLAPALAACSLAPSLHPQAKARVRVLHIGGAMPPPSGGSHSL